MTCTIPCADDKLAVEQRKNAFTLLMSSAARGQPPEKLPLPQKKGVAEDEGGSAASVSVRPQRLRGDWRLFNDLIDLFASRCLGFSGGVEKTSGKTFMNTLASVLFELLVPEGWNVLRLGT